MNKMKPALTALFFVILLFVFARNMINTARADLMFDSPGIFESSVTPAESTSFYKQDGSLVNVYGAEEVGIAIKDGEQEYFVIPKDDGSPAFIYANELIICTNTGCY